MKYGAPSTPTCSPSEETPPLRADLSAPGVVPPAVLHDDEIVVLLLKPSLWFIPFTSFRFILTVALLGVLAVKVSQTAAISARTLALMTMLVCLGRLIWALLVWTSYIYMLTNQRVLTIKGVLNVDMFQAPLRKLQRTTLYRPWYLRLFATGTIGLATAATTGYDSTWVMLSHPIEVHEQLVAAINKSQ